MFIIFSSNKNTPLFDVINYEIDPINPIKPLSKKTPDPVGRKLDVLILGKVCKNVCYAKKYRSKMKLEFGLLNLFVPVANFFFTGYCD